MLSLVVPIIIKAMDAVRKSEKQQQENQANARFEETEKIRRSTRVSNPDHPEVEATMITTAVANVEPSQPVDPPKYAPLKKQMTFVRFNTPNKQDIIDKVIDWFSFVGSQFKPKFRVSKAVHWLIYHPIVENLITMVLIFSTVVMASHIHAEDPAPDATNYLWTLDRLQDICSGIFLAEMILKVVAVQGVITYFRDLDNIRDGTIVTTSIITWILEYGLGQPASGLMIFRLFRLSRLLRLYRLLSKIPGLMDIVNTLKKSAPALAQVTQFFY